MKRIVIGIIALLASAVFSTAYAQARHDEKPHGMTKSAAAETDKTRVAGTGGRHDEGGTTHGKKKPAAKKDQPKTDDSNK